MALVPAKCTQCGGNIEVDATKEAGMCPHCGTAFITERVIKNYNTVVNNTNNYEGATINYYGNQAMLEKHLANARRAKEKEDWEEVEKYYNLAEECDPTCIEAIFYSSFAKAKNSLRNADLYKRKNAFGILGKSISVIDDNYNMEKKEEQAKLILQIDRDIVGMITGSYIYNQKKNGYGIVTWTDKGETETLFRVLCANFIETLANIIQKYPTNDPETKFLYILMANHCAYILNMGVGDREKFQNLYMTCHQKAHELDPNHQIPEQAPKGTVAKTSGKTIGGIIIGLIAFIIFLVYIISIFM